MTPERERTVAALEAVIDETRSLFHRLRRAAEEIHQQGELTAGRRGVLRDLKRLGPRTVPQLARRRPVSRQHIQTLINPLVEEGLVELVDNPAHRRSRLARLTPRGSALVEAMEARERQVLEGRIRALATAGEEAVTLEAAARTLAAVRRALEDPSWKTSLDDSPRRGDSARRASRFGPAPEYRLGRERFKEESFEPFAPARRLTAEKERTAETDGRSFEASKRRPEKER